jgi:hypothetical protein
MPLHVRQQLKPTHNSAFSIHPLFKKQLLLFYAKHQKAGRFEGAQMLLNNSRLIMQRYLPAAKLHNLTAKTGMVVISYGFVQFCHGFKFLMIVVWEGYVDRVQTSSLKDILLVNCL